MLDSRIGHIPEGAVILKVVFLELLSDSSKQMIEQSRCCCMHDMEIIVGGPSCVILEGRTLP